MHRRSEIEEPLLAEDSSPQENDTLVVQISPRQHEIEDDLASTASVVCVKKKGLLRVFDNVPPLYLVIVTAGFIAYMSQFVETTQELLDKAVLPLLGGASMLEIRRIFTKLLAGKASDNSAADYLTLFMLEFMASYIALLIQSRERIETPLHQDLQRFLYSVSLPANIALFVDGLCSTVQCFFDKRKSSKKPL